MLVSVLTVVSTNDLKKLLTKFVKGWCIQNLCTYVCELLTSRRAAVGWCDKIGRQDSFGAPLKIHMFFKTPFEIPLARLA